MPITWQTRGAGPLEHRYHRLTEAQVAALAPPEAVGVHPVDVDGEVVYGLAAHSTMVTGRPLLWSPVVYPTAAECETQAEAWITRDRETFYASRGG